ncbi:MAG: hypothetical protein K6E18_08720 [Lachnospiraceae bacterium]|nr:hypothetical protein [Lachnospiraceae bacterium]
MDKQKGMDMTVGSPFQKIVLFTIPLILGNILQQLHNLGDTKVVSFYLHEHAFAAVGMTAVISNTLIGLVNGFTQGFGILTAAAFGMKNPVKIRKNVAGSFVLTVILTTLLMTGAFLSIRNLLVLLHTPELLIDQAEAYIRIIFLGLPFTALYNLTANQLRSLGESKVPLYCLTASIFLNLLLDILAAHTSGRRVLDIQMTLLYTFGFAMTTYVSQNFGAGRVDRIKQGVKTAIGIVSVLSLCLIVFSMFFARILVTWIASTDNQLIIENATMYCRVGTWFFPALGPLFILRCSLQGMGHRVVPLSTSVLEFFVKIFSVAILVPYLGYLGVALTEPISWVLMASILAVGYLAVMRKRSK